MAGVVIMGRLPIKVGLSVIYSSKIVRCTTSTSESFKGRIAKGLRSQCMEDMLKVDLKTSHPWPSIALATGQLMCSSVHIFGYLPDASLKDHDRNIVKSCPVTPYSAPPGTSFKISQPYSSSNFSGSMPMALR